MFTVISRIFHFGAKNFWRNGWLSTTTIAIMTLALVVFFGLVMFGVVAKAAATIVENEINISVYFKSTTSEDEILNIQQSLQQLSQVDTVDYISRDQALATFQQNHASDQTISAAINALDSNPLEASLNIKAKNPSDYGQINDYLSSSDLSQYIDTTTYPANETVINRLANIVRDVNVGGLILIVLLGFIAGLVVFNTIRLAIYSNREEIGIMRVVGASNALVRGPYVVEGVIWGVSAAVLSLIVMAPVCYFAAPYLTAFLYGTAVPPDALNAFQYFYSHIFQLLFYQIIFGVGIGIFSSYWAVQRYLKN